MKVSVITFFVIILLFFNNMEAQTWDAPTDAKGVKSPIEVTIKNIEKGSELYQLNCKSCHGDPGQANAIVLTPPPPDLITDRVQLQTEGEIFFKITAGRTPMPAYEKVLAEDDRWRIVMYVKTLLTGIPGKQSTLLQKADLKLSYDTATKKLSAKVISLDEPNSGTPAGGIQVEFLAKRYFGLLLIGQAVKTDSSGVASVVFPNDLPGDSTGNVVVIARLKANTKIVVQEAFAAGKPTIPTNILAERSMWTVRSNAPIWLIITYLLSFIAVWSVIIYIVLLIVKIRKAKTA